MLVLSRHRDEEILIGHHGEIRITIIDIRGDKVRVGIEAARDVPVHRREVYEQIQAERRARHDDQTGPTSPQGDEPEWS